jgi:phosphoribosylformimino-5-aminoimidazole carboxamide ribotide isomerase
LTGVNIEETVNLAKSVSIPVVASGGVASIKDIEELSKYEKDGIEGVIVGKAYYEGRISKDDFVRLGK